MDSETRLSRDFDYVAQAHKLRNEYIARLLHAGVAALSGSNQKAAKPAAAYRSKPRDFCSQG